MINIGKDKDGNTLYRVMPDGKLNYEHAIRHRLGKEKDDCTTEEYEAELVKIKEDIAATEYQRNRLEDYWELNQFELISDDTINGTTTHKDAIEAIKTKWPKDNSGPVE